MGRRSYEVSVNLVPYIDLMTTIVTFLMMTAVWMQASALEVWSKESETLNAAPTLQSQPIVVGIQENGLVVFQEGRPGKTITKRSSAHDFEELGVYLRALHEGTAPSEEIHILPDDSIQYDHIVRVIDLARGAGFAQIVLRPSV